MKKTALNFWTTVILSLGIPLMVGSSSQAAPNNTEFKIGIAQEFESFNPAIMSMVATQYMFQMVGHALVTLDANAHWVPQLVKSIPSLENKQAKFSSDKKTIIATWELKDNANWGDGTPVTCADLAFTREVGMNDNISIPNKELYTQITKIEWDPKTPKKCVFTYDKARWDFYQLGDFRPLPDHLERPIYEKYKNQKEGYEKNTNYTKNPTMDGLYNGPYKISEIKLSDHVTFVPNPQFYGKQPKIKKIQVKLIPNTGTLEANLRSGTVDKISSLGFAFDQALAFDKRVRAEKMPYEVVFKSSTTYEHIDLNLDNPILKDVRVRKAMVYAINREELVKALFEGKQEVAIHNTAPIDPWYTKDPKKIVLYPYSKKDATRLLEDAGWKMEADGYRHKDGKKLSLTFMTTAGDKTRENVQVFLQNQWKAVGIEILIKNQPARVFFGETTRHREFEAMAMYAWESSPETSPKTNLYSEKIPTEKNGWSGQNTTGYSSPKMDDYLNKLDGEFNAGKRKELMANILHLYTDDVFVIPLYYRAKVAVIPVGLTGFNMVSHQYAETNNVQDWEMKEK
jgi:peptide/nickel transport system substrate-binding protein